MKKPALWALGVVTLLGAGLTIPAQADPSQGESVDPALTQTVEADEEEAPQGTPVELSAGHIDMGARMNPDFELMARDDTGETPVWRHLDDVVFRIGEQGKLEVPDTDEYAFTQAKGTAWVIPQNEIQDVVWLDWNTQDPGLLEQSTGGVDLIFQGHQGPGVLTTFVEAGNFSGPEKLWDSTVEEAQPIHVEPNVHTHVNWVFTEPGEHAVRITAQTTVNNEKVEDTQVLHFAVGPDADAAAARALSWDDEVTMADAGEQQDTAAADKESATTQAETDDGSHVLLIGGIVLAAVIVVAAIVAIVMRKRSQAQKDEALR